MCVSVITFFVEKSVPIFTLYLILFNLYHIIFLNLFFYASSKNILRFAVWKKMKTTRDKFYESKALFLKYLHQEH